MKTWKCAAAVLVWLAASAGPAAAARLSDLAWIAGAWTGRMGAGHMEEIWTAPDETSMVGTFRAHQAGRATFYEFMTIDQTADELVLRLRHFAGDLAAQEDKDGTLKFACVSAGRNRAVFENKATTPPERLTYTRLGKHLVIQLDAVHGGKPESSTFKLRRR